MSSAIDMATEDVNQKVLRSPRPKRLRSNCRRGEQSVWRPRRPVQLMLVADLLRQPYTNEEVEHVVTPTALVRRIPSNDASIGRQYTVSTPLLYSDVNGTNVKEIQMFADFYEKYITYSVNEWRQITYLRALMDLEPTTQLLKSAKRTIGLAHLAAKSQDGRLAREARISYSQLLGMLQFSLAFPTKTGDANHTRQLAASIALLTHLSDPISSVGQSDDSWTTHMAGGQQLLTKYAATQLYAADKLDVGLMRHTIMNGLYLAIAKRKNFFIDTNLLDGIESKGWTAMVQAAHRLPGLLARTDQALPQAQNLYSLAEIAFELAETREKAMNVCPDAQHPSSICTRPSKFMSAEVEEHCVMMDSETFPEMFVPMTKDGGAVALKLVLSTCLALISECTILRIRHFHPEVALLTSNKANPPGHHHAYHLSRQLCKIALSFTQTDKIVHISILRLCLTLARNVFEQQEALPEMGWCNACLIANDMRMRRVRSTCAPTLCKIEDVMAGIAEAGRYKQKFNSDAFIIRPTQSPSMRLLE